MKTELFKTDLLNGFADLLLENGFRVFYPQDSQKIFEVKPSYFFFSEGNDIGYVQEDFFGGLKFSTVHRSNAVTGHGFALTDNDHRHFEVPSLREARKAFCVFPAWCRNTKEQNSVIKFKSPEEWLESRVVINYKELKNENTTALQQGSK